MASRVSPKRPIAGAVEIDGHALRWSLRSEPKWATADDYVGTTLLVERTDGTFRALILQYPFPEAYRAIGGRYYLTRAPLPQKANVQRNVVEADIRRAIAAGWEPDSRGKPFVYHVPEGA